MCPESHPPRVPAKLVAAAAHALRAYRTAGGNVMQSLRFVNIELQSLRCASTNCSVDSAVHYFEIVDFRVHYLQNVDSGEVNAVESTNWK